MSQSADRQSEFAIALLDPGRPVPAGIVGPDGDPCPKRFAVYRNNVVVGLREALKAAYPAVLRLVGEEFFDAMAGIYVRAAPPQSPIMLDYGASFPAFIKTFSPAANVPYLSDVARIERAWLEAYHTAEACPLAAEAFAAIPTNELPGIRLLLHPSVRVVRSNMPAFTIWRMNIIDGVPDEVTLEEKGEDTLVVRPEATVEVRSLPAGAADFIDALLAGHTVAEAAELAAACDGRFELPSNIAGLIEAGAIFAYQTSSGVCFEGRRERR